MEKKILEGLWDCPYCGSKGIRGLVKTCPTCGHPQDEGTKFYVGTARNYLDEEQAKEYGKGADWTCAFCGSLNRFSAVECENCSAPREEGASDYYRNQQKQAEKAAEKAAVMDELTGDKEARERALQAAIKKRRTVFAIIALVILGLIINSLIPRKKDAKITDMAWEREIGIEEYKMVQEQAWTVPDGGTVVSESQEIYGYNSVLDHYEDVQVEHSRDVIVDYTTEVTYEDNGDGTFNEISEQVPVYGTEYYYETESQPVYIQVPVYQTWYTYDIPRWVAAGSEKASGNGDEAPAWPKLKLDDNEREAWRDETYELEITAKKDTYTVEVSESVWESYKVGDKVELVLNASGRPIEVDGSRVR